MAVTSPPSPDDVLLKALSKRPVGTECVLLFDPDRLMD